MRPAPPGLLCPGAEKKSRKLKDSVTFVAFFCNKSLVRYPCKSQESFFSFFNLRKNRAGEWFTQALFFCPFFVLQTPVERRRPGPVGLSSSWRRAEAGQHEWRSVGQTDRLFDRTNLFSGFSGGRLETNGHDAGGIGAGGRGGAMTEDRPPPSDCPQSQKVMPSSSSMLSIRARDSTRTPLPRMRAPPGWKAFSMTMPAPTTWAPA